TQWHMAPAREWCVARRMNSPADHAAEPQAAPTQHAGSASARHPCPSSTLPLPIGQVESDSTERGRRSCRGLLGSSQNLPGPRTTLSPLPESIYVNIASVASLGGASAPRFFLAVAERCQRAVKARYWGWLLCVWSYETLCLFFPSNFLSSRIALSTCFSSNR